MRRFAPIALVLVLLLVVGLPALAWAQDMQLPVPAPSGSLGDVGSGALGGTLTGILALALNEWRRSRADDQEVKARAEITATAAAAGARVDRLAELHNALSKQVERLDERMIAHAKQADQVHGDLEGIRESIVAVRDRLPPRITG